MSKVQVEVYFTDKLESIRVNQWQMEIPNAIRKKPMVEWFKPAAGRVNWDGLGAEIKAMGFSGEKNTVYSFLFIGPEDKKQEFMACVERFCLGEEAQQETKKETEQDYLHNAQNYQQAGNAEMAFQQYMVAARDYGHPEAQFEVARCYQNGTGVEKSEENAFVWYKKAAEQGNAEAQCVLGGCFYYQTLGVEKDDKEARKWYEAAATQGNVTAQYMTGRLYAELSYNEAAVKWYTKAAEQECPEAQYELGDCYSYGIGVAKDLEQAFEWYQKSAENGNATAQFNLGYCYGNGEGVEKNSAKAVEWYRKSAEQGYAMAQCKLGYCYDNGEGVEKNSAKAVEWYRKAAENGNATAQKNLGVCYEYGRGVTLSKATAAEWYRKAADQGNENAKKALDKMQGIGIGLVRKLTSERK